ncbi:MAG: hypothetical protein PHV16_00985 [Candidatus Nanoarchaeia archaeon]|nr:hypothetical protein [Candidatus Nanoarchaeia archaeon]
MAEVIKLGGGIELKGFLEIDGGTMIILKKIIGSYSRKFSDNLKEFEKLVLELNQQGEESEVFGTLVVGEKEKTAKIVDKNLFVAVDKVLKAVEREVL